MRPAQLLAAYWPNAEAVHSVFQETYIEYKTYVTQGLQGESVLVSDVQPDWYRLLAGQSVQDVADPWVGREWEWLNIGGGL